MFCPNCGEEQPNNAVFCSQCGSKIGVENVSNQQSKEENTDGNIYNQMNMQGAYNQQYNMQKMYGQPNPNIQVIYGQPNLNMQGVNYNQNRYEERGKEPSFFEFYQRAFVNYFNFEGRTSRKGYWMFVLCNLIFTVLLRLADYGFVNQIILNWIYEGYIGDTYIDTFNTIVNYFGGCCSLIYSLAVMIPSIAIVVRRLHDIELSGMRLLVLVLLSGILLFCQIWIIILIVLVGWIYFIILLASKGTDKPNKYGKSEW